MSSPETARLIAGLPRKRIGAGVLFVDESDRALLVEPTYKPYWEIPGGVVEDRESPHAAAAREVREELGLTVFPGGLLVVDWVPPGLYPDDGVMFIYDGGILTTDRTDAIVLQTEELRGWSWCDDAEAAERLPAVLARRVAAARTARKVGIPMYLEDGVRISVSGR
ncbi:NUDIX domain-containing protein [Nocardia pseudobrasiliensis]|uniref:NUDIX domain-containing protein n=1 Tax=Nocardia pseudobrasiliensis TaxID=45979 RepID=A0A370IEV2_9NOCA|nr:NUDIX hydrolase [Nocardia pseudobrasiliensis]RDI67974.1 NUDIX domain-containing protein [Nocardia pseudobrasiliensis]